MVSLSGNKAMSKAHIVGEAPTFHIGCISVLSVEYKKNASFL